MTNKKVPPSRHTPWQRRYQRFFYNASQGWIDGTTEFQTLVRSVWRPNDRILEIGSGPANPMTKFLHTLGEVHGLDPDPAVLNNPDLSAATVLTATHYPLPNDSFDLCVSNYVIEHVADGLGHLKEVARVLKPGGAYVFRTVNRWHYVAVIAAVTPQWFHSAVANRARRLDRGAHEPYRTAYNLNTSKAVQDAARGAKLSVEYLRYVEKEPSYGMFSRVAFLLMVGYERLVNSTPWLSALRANMFVVLRK